MAEVAMNRSTQKMWFILHEANQYELIYVQMFYCSDVDISAADRNVLNMREKVSNKFHPFH